MIRKNRLRLFVVGAVMVASLSLAAYVPYFWAPGIVLALAGVYLLTWATLGKGSWCRTCKKFSLAGRPSPPSR
jgi:hypothetical protein